jgi:ubiquinone/menaquinone biosynthesis C-methylase UbiE
MNDRVFKHAHAHKLEDPERLTWMPPAEALSYLRLSEGMRIADIGAGTGYFAIPMAAAVGASGHVFAIDLQPEMIEKLRAKLDAAGKPKNISLREGAASAVPLPDTSVDVVFYANIWHEIDDQEAVLREAFRILVLTGTIAILDWRQDKPSPPGPPQEHRIPVDSVVRFLQKHGCQRVTSHEVGSFSYIVTAALPGAE